jgi:hypothetical protein
LPFPAAPPNTKRGVQTTNDSNVGVHWYGLSHPDESGRAFCDLLGVPEEQWRDADHGMAHYPRCRFLGSIRVGYGGDQHNGSHMEASGRACEEIEAMPGFTTWGALFAKAEAMSFKPTRVDVYKDVRDGSIAVGEVRSKWCAGEVSSRAKEAKPYSTEPLGCGEDNTGETYGIGSRKSESYLRIYDKAKEQAPNDDTREVWLRDCGPWVRIEMELKDGRASLLCRDVATRGWGPETVGRVVNGHTEFKETNARGKNRYRAEVWEPWRKALATAEKLRRSVEGVLRTIGEMERNLERQWGPTIATLLAYYKGDTSWVQRMAARNYERVNRKQIEALEHAERARETWAAA